MKVEDVKFEDMKWKRMNEAAIDLPLFEYLRKIFAEETAKRFRYKKYV